MATKVVCVIIGHLFSNHWFVNKSDFTFACWKMQEEVLNARTRMHSSRMLTVRCSGRLWGGGGVGVCLGGVSAQMGCLPRGGVSWGWGVSAQGGVCIVGGVCRGGCLPNTPPWTEWQTGVKTLPCHNYVADGNKNTIHTRHVSRPREAMSVATSTSTWPSWNFSNRPSLNCHKNTYILLLFNEAFEAKTKWESYFR